MACGQQAAYPCSALQNRKKKKKREEKATTAVPPPRHLFCRVSSIALPLLPALHLPLFPRRRWMCAARCPQHPCRSLCRASGIAEEVRQEATPRHQPPVTWKRALPLTPQPIRRDGFRGNNCTHIKEHKVVRLKAYLRHSARCLCCLKGTWG